MRLQELAVLELAVKERNLYEAYHAQYRYTIWHVSIPNDPWTENTNYYVY